MRSSAAATGADWELGLPASHYFAQVSLGQSAALGRVVTPVLRLRDAAGRSQRVTTPHCFCGNGSHFFHTGAPPTDSVLEPEPWHTATGSKRWLAFPGVSFS